MGLIWVAVLLVCAAGCWYGGRRLLRGDLPRWWADALDRRPKWLIALFFLPVIALVGLGLAVLWYALQGSTAL